MIPTFQAATGFAFYYSTLWNLNSIERFFITIDVFWFFCEKRLSAFNKTKIWELTAGEQLSYVHVIFSD